MWHCNKCNTNFRKLDIAWGRCGKQKVDVIDYFCPECGSGAVKFTGTEDELNKYWDVEWDS